MLYGDFQMANPQKIRVLECIRQGQIGGGESHLLSLIENLNTERFDPVVLSFTEGLMVDKLREKNIKVYVIPTTTAFDVRVWGKVKALLQNENIELVHAHGSRANSNVNYAARKLGIPVIYTIHGWSFHDDQPGWKKRLRIWGEKWLTERSDTNISVSASNQASGKKVIESFRSIVVNNGINETTFTPDRYDRKAIREELQYCETDIVVLFLARFTQHKQPLLLLRAFRKAATQNPRLKLLMVGDGDQKEEGIKLWHGSGIQERIQLLPFREDVPQLLSAADIYVLPSLWEGLPIGLLEAMSMEKAIIASAVDGTKEIIQNEETGILIPVDALEEKLSGQIIELANDEAKRKRMGSTARMVVKHKFNSGSMTRTIEDIYNMHLIPN